MGDGMRKKGDLAEICLDKINLGGGGDGACIEHQTEIMAAQHI